MAFELQNWVRATAASNAGKTAGGQGGPTIFSYQSSADDAATIGANDYFSEVVFETSIGDIIFINAADAFIARRISALDREAKTIDTESIGLNDAIGTGNIENKAITQDKIDDEAVGEDQLEDDAVVPNKVIETFMQHAQVSFTEAEWDGMYADPIELVPAIAGHKPILFAAKIHLGYGGTVFADGGAIHVQYDDTTFGAGTKATDTYAAGTWIGHTASTTIGLTPVQTALADATTIGKSLCLSNATAAFTGGDDAIITVDIWYAYQKLI